MAPSPVPDPAALLVETFRTFERLYAHWMQSLVEGSGVSPARMRLLGVLHCRGPQIMCDLGEQLGVTPRNVTTLVDGLEQEGLVRRVPHATDRRATVIELTAQGGERAGQLLGPFHEKLVGLFGGLAKADQDELLRLMQALLDALRRRGPGS
jgi:DNA-binding MarR family transcriptional regulator